MLAGQDDPRAVGPLGVEDVAAEQVAPVRAWCSCGLAQHLAGARRARTGRRRSGRAGGAASRRSRARGSRSRRPARPPAARPSAAVRSAQRVDDGAHPHRRQGGEAGVVVAGEADDLAAAQRRAVLEGGRRDRPRRRAPPGRQRREAVLEDDHVVVGVGHLGGLRPAAGGAQRARVARRAGSVRFMPVRGDRHPLAGQRRRSAMLAGSRAARRARGCRRRSRAGAPGRVVEVDELAAVGERARRAPQRARRRGHPASPPPERRTPRTVVGSVGATSASTRCSTSSSSTARASGRQPVVGDQDVDVAQRHERREPDDAPLGVVGEHAHRAAGPRPGPGWSRPRRGSAW